MGCPGCESKRRSMWSAQDRTRQVAEVLKEIEHGYLTGTCPSCGWTKPEHSQLCRLAAVLSTVNKK